MVDSTLKKSFINWGAQTLANEASSLLECSKKLDETFAEAVSLILECNGKVATTGLGKSGHIARKISSTLASTGTPSYYLHPSEALHGDFGMLSANDCLLTIAFSGETPEVVEVVRFARRVGLKIITITGKLESTLARLSHSIINASVSEEACPLNLAPTSSSTLSLALGDALAVSLMRARGFAEQDFANLHPGGVIGRKLALVKDHMRGRDEVQFINLESDFSEIVQKIAAPNFGIVGIVDAAGQLLGAISDGDLRRALLKFREKIINKSAKEIMTTAPKTICETSLTLDAFKKMEDSKITNLFVTNKENPKKTVGLVRMHDLLEAKII